MTTREKKITRAILDVLHEREGGAMTEADLFQDVNSRCLCANAEFKATLALCDAQGWLTGVKSKFAGQVWAINEEGEIARLQIRN